MTKRIIAFFVSLFLLAGSLTAYAHSGGTDANGGHNVAGGGYHYHHGYPAHQHTDGICPYDYDDKTDYNSGSTTKKKTTTTTTKTKTSTKKHYEEKITDKIGMWIVNLLILVFFILPIFSVMVLPLISKFHDYIKNRKK